MKPPNIAPFYASLYPGLCDVARARGYALAIHGTLASDLDLIACPWTAHACSAEDLRAALMEHIGACDYEGSLVRFGLPPAEARTIAERSAAEKTDKPHGRVAWNLYLANGCKVDLSVMPRGGAYEKAKLQSIIDTFCDRLDWGDPAWKAQPHIKALFDLRSERP